jgi:hypothetical protein
LRKAEAVQASEMTILVHNCHRTTCSFHAASQLCPVCTQTATYMAHFFQVNFELHPYDVEKWAASRWNHRQLKIGRRQLDLWHRLKMGTYSGVLSCMLTIPLMNWFIGTS